MPANNSQMYLFLSINASNLTPCPQTFLDAYPIIKVAATEETEAVYYTEDDGLSIKEIMELHKSGLEHWYYDDTSDAAPIKPVEAVIEDGVEISPAVAANYISFKLINPTGIILMTFAAGFQAYAAATNQTLNPNLSIQSRDDWKKFISNT